MSRPTRTEPRWADVAALLLLGAGGLASWWGDLGSGVLWLAPPIVAAALTAGGLLGTRASALLAVAWVPGALLAAGLPVGNLAPAALDTTVTSLRVGLQALPTIGTATPILQVWALAAVLLLAGPATLLAGILWRETGWLRTLAGLALLLAPLGAAIAMQETPDSSWQGAVVLVAIVLRLARGRLLPIVTAATMVGAVALFGAQVAAPRAGWQPFDQHAEAPHFHELETKQTYGPLETKRTGAVMLNVNAPQPALWRVQVLEAFDNRRWIVSRESTSLPEPAARPESIGVEVQGLHDQSVVSPGRIIDVSGPLSTIPEPGEGRGIPHKPHEGEVYRVEAETVHASIARLAKVPVPKGRRYQALTQIGLGPLPPYIPYPLTRLAKHMPGPLKGTDWGRLFRLAARLSDGEKSELGIVRRVEDYLLRGDRFRYTTDVGPPSFEPLLEFLFHTHAGYCQHFAGAAALLLRVSGVPSRVAVGFATGEQTGKHSWAVRDEDAHAWIEVYFPRVGWVPFNPTPAAAEADVSPGIDVLQPAVAAAGGPNGTLPQLAAGAAALLLLFLATRLLRRGRTPRTSLAELLIGLAPQLTGPRTTLRSLHPGLTEIGPATADLALVAERARFAGADPLQSSHPNLAVWRALVSDVGFPRACGLMLRAATATHRA